MSDKTRYYERQVLVRRRLREEQAAAAERALGFALPAANAD